MSEGHAAANPAPAGLVALAMVCFTFYALHTGKVDPSAAILLGIWLFGGFVIQMIVAIMELNHGNVLGGNVFLYFSGFFMLVTSMELIFKFFAAQNGWAFDARIDGYAWAALTIALLTWTPGYFKSPLTMTIAVLLIDVALIAITLMDLGLIGRQWHALSGNTLGLAGIFALWTAAGVVLNNHFGKPVVPMGSPIIK